MWRRRHVKCLASAESFWFSLFVAARDASPTQHVSIWRPGNETQQSTVFVVRSGTAGTNPADSTFNFNSLWIILTQRELQLALTTNEGDFSLWYSEYMSEPVIYYFYLGRETKSVLLTMECTLLVESHSVCDFFQPYLISMSCWFRVNQLRSLS